MPEGISVSPGNIGRVLDVKLSVSIELGNTEENINTLLQWTEGSLIELDKVSGEPVDVIVNNKPYARGEVVVIAECFGVRLTKISPAPARSPV
jgi:flagellar motor switch protein FliN/FliY